MLVMVCESEQSSATTAAWGTFAMTATTMMTKGEAVGPHVLHMKGRAYPLVIKHGNAKSHRNHEMEVLTGESPMNGPFSIVMLNYQ